MARLCSAGLHKPSALSYLISEGVLPEQPDPSSYRWSQQVTLDDVGTSVREEILTLDHCVVWSRNRTVKRIFNLDIEGELILHAFTTSFSSTPITSASLERPQLVTSDFHSKENALVVVLRTQIHIFCLSGGIHVIPLPFVTARSFPFPGGCVLQPQNSQSGHYRGDNLDPLLDHSQDVQSLNTPLSRLLAASGTSVNGAKPPARSFPTYCITDILSDVGLVGMTLSRKPQVVINDVLPADEEIIYMSTDGSLHGIQHWTSPPFCVAVTLNRGNSTFTIWSVSPNEIAADRVERSSDVSRYRKRQSAIIHDRPRVPSGRPPPETSRESLGGLIQSFVDNPTNTQEPRLSNIEDLAAELHDEFEPGGIQTRSSRRISSMIARSELAASTERSAFNDNLRIVSSRKSLSRSMRREGSFGSVTERNSLGGRRSFAGPASILSTNSFLNPSDRMSFGEPTGSGALDSHHFASGGVRLQKDLTFYKLKSVPCDEVTRSGVLPRCKILLIPHPPSFDSDNAPSTQISICIQECEPQIMTVVTIAVKKTSYENRRHEHAKDRPELKAVQVQKGTNITDACLVSDDRCNRLLVLTRTSQGDGMIHLEAPWSPSFRLELPQKYLIHSTNTPFQTPPETHANIEGAHRTIDGSDVKPSHFLTAFDLENVVLCDTSARRHDLRLELIPASQLGREVIEICRFILPTQHQDSLLVAFWEIRRWLDTQEVQGNLENIAIAITLFSMAVPFISTFQERPLAPNRKKKTVNLRSSSGGFVDATDWSFMQTDEASGKSPAWTRSSTWTWLNSSLHPVVLPKSPSKHVKTTLLDQSQSHSNRIFLSQCVDLTRDFLQSPAGENMSGTEGYLPSAINQDRNTRRTALASIFIALFLLLQEVKLRSCSDESTNNDRTTLTILVAQLSLWLKWPSWKERMLSEYENEGFSKDGQTFDQSMIDVLDIPPEPFAPISIFEYIQRAIRGERPKYHTLVDLLRTDEFVSNDPISIESMKLLPKSSAIVNFFTGKEHQVSLATVSNMSDIIAAACKPPLMVYPSFTDGEGNGIFSSQKSAFGLHVRAGGIVTPSHAHRQPSHLATRDTRVLGTQALEAESLSRWDLSLEIDRQAVTKLIFHQDRRFQDASKLVNQTRAPEIEFDFQPNWTEANALEAQKQLTQYATRRTFAVATGRGMMHFNVRSPLLTEMLPVPKFSLQCIMRSRSETENGQPMTFSADRSHFTEEKVYWAFFHNGASAGLMISKEAEFIDTSWILYNKPAELTNRHAGLLLALGLNGHLRSLAKWVAFKYLTPKHTMTSVGLLLGLAASYRGTADTLITRLLSVHVTCLLPPGAAELNLSPLTQMTGIMGIGLVYCNTQHRRMSEVMLSEIECQDIEDRSGDEPILRDEGYRLISGMSLGLINLGHGSQLHSLHDMRLVERLLAIAVGTKNVKLVHVLDRATAGAVLALAFVFMKTDDMSVARKVDIPDTIHQFEYVRPDIFLLRTLARHIIMWSKIVPTPQFVRDSLPSQYRHRTDLSSIKRLVTNDLPFFHIVAGICFAVSLRYAGSQRPDARDLLVEYLDQLLRLSRLPAHSYDARVTLNGIRNCLDILALSCATVMAGSGDVVVFRRLRALHGRTDKDTPYGSHLAAHMAIGALFLSGGTATFGTSDIAVASLIIAFYPLFPNEILDNRGHLQALRHLWVIAVEHRCLIARDNEDGQVIGGINATLVLKDGTQSTLRTPGLLPDLDSLGSISIKAENYWPIEIDLDHNYAETPESQSNVKSTRETVRDRFKSSSTGIQIKLYRRPIYDKPKLNPFDSELEALDTAHHIPGGPSHSATTTQNSTDARAPLDWIFTLPTFKSLDHAERSLVLDGDGSAPSSQQSPRTDGDTVINGLLATTPIDTRLELEFGTLGPENAKIPRAMRKEVRNNKLWLIRVLLDWADRIESENSIRGGGTDGNRIQAVVTTESDKLGSTGLRRDVVERLRWRIWRMCSVGDESGVGVGNGGEDHEAGA